ncbi:MAG: GtrA family protein [Lachnospiraceae bacterium]|nr:GtrA family protein [Lachnospiraceae bacterium]
MKEKFKYLFKKYCTREIITYVIAGLLTTAVNFLCSYLLYNVLLVEENLTNAIAWVVAVVFAFFINNYWVFKAGDDGKKNETVKFFKFVALRGVTLVIELGLPFIFVTLLGFPYWPVKIVMTIIITVLNYVFGRFLVFIKSKKSTEETGAAQERREDGE